MDASASAPAPPALASPPLRRLHHRMTCSSCDVAWTGPASSTCWFCSGPGLCAPPPSIYSDPNQL